MNYDWLFSFVVFSEHLNFTRAAEQLHITQPALHAQVRRLSEQLGLRLYRRRGRALELTEEGRRLAAFGRQTQAEGEALCGQLRGEEGRAPVTLAAGQGAFLYLLGPAIRRFRAEGWPLRALPTPGPAAVEAVVEARADVAVAVLQGRPSALDRKPLCKVGQVVLLPKEHKLAGRRRLRPRDLEGEALIVAPEGRPHRAMIAQALSGLRWSVAVEAMGWELMLHLARCGLGLAIVNDFCPPPPGMRALPLGGLPKVEYQLLTRPGTQREAVQRLAELIANLDQEPKVG